MSIVLSYVDTEKAIVASDGLVSNENKDAVFCNEIKVFRINQNVLLGFAGHLLTPRQKISRLLILYPSMMLAQLYKTVLRHYQTLKNVHF